MVLYFSLHAPRTLSHADTGTHTYTHTRAHTHTHTYTHIQVLKYLQDLENNNKVMVRKGTVHCI